MRKETMMVETPPTKLLYSSWPSKLKVIGAENTSKTRTTWRIFFIIRLIMFFLIIYVKRFATEYI